ncbi:single-stranded DNA-binding protein [Enterococcus sp. RIT-PI-f]|uniref:single-stranded DNA-binding protein n=1 Tax=Enterococcus sp. RIT-PI-f TaxID=1690244 RepID=UPI0006B8A17C|nr:single-stranded DNA-binding protein [Enterococcus sp. RIT-PI-f]KPG70844.1 single-stranded DNA-binding protein [Enterococcus sp. RIT-PI-f]
MLNVHCIEGRLAETPQLKTTDKGTYYTRVLLVSKRNYKTKKESDYQSDSFLCVLYGAIARSFVEMTCRGSHVSFVGRVQTRSYQNQSGERCFISEDIVQSYNLLENKEITDNRRKRLAQEKPAEENEINEYRQAVEHIPAFYDEAAWYE